MAALAVASFLFLPVVPEAGTMNEADVIVVLGGYAPEREREAERLFRSGVSSTVVVSGDGGNLLDQLVDEIPRDQ
ncbi:MAG: hypothetical protein ACQKBU_04205, partial [Verrucomicrobiales bacterium]